MATEDQVLPCVECRASFTWSAGEQEFYAAKGLTHPPRRCRDCRARRKLQAGEAYAITCAACGKPGTVPFPPRGDRPVYCDACHAARRGIA